MTSSLFRSSRLSTLAAFVGLGTLLALDAGAGAGAGAWSETPQAKVRLVSRWAVAPAGADAGLGVELTLIPGWHVYWKNSGDAGYPPALELAPALGLGPATLRFPAPHRYDLPGDLVAFGYEEHVIYPLDTRIAADAPAALALAGRLDYLVCRGECIPYTAELTLELAVGAGAEDPETAAGVDAWRARLPIPVAAATPAVTVVTEWVSGDYPWSTLELRLSAEGLRATAPDLFFAPQDWVELRRPELVATGEGPAFRVPFRAFDETRPLPEPLVLEWTATGFELGSGPIALEGRTSLSPAAAAVRTRLYWILAIATLVALLALARKIKPRRQGVPT